MIAVQEVKVGSRTRQVQVRPFAWNYMYQPMYQPHEVRGFAA